jgi:hypothetical protein
VYDLKNFAKLKKMGELAPAAMDAYWRRRPGELNRKTREPTR